VTSSELKRWLEKRGCTFTPGKGSHLHVQLGSRFTVLPMHGGKREMKSGTVNAIKKDLGLK
jgi:mRNA interferase HicA